MNGRRNSGAPPNGRKLERDEDLLLFRELHKREKDIIASLLQPVSDEFEPNGGNYALYRIASGKKGSGYEFFPENNKNDYDWLKTPPATPLFPSLEMEAANNNGAELVIQRELPIIQPLSRFADNKEPSKSKNFGRPKSPNPKPKIPSSSITPSHHRPSIEPPKNTKVTTLPATKTATSQPTNGISNSKPYSNIKDDHDHLDYLATNLSKNLGGTSSHKTKPAARSRGVSPMTRSTIPPQLEGLIMSDETPPNLKTDRSTSATRRRLLPPNLKTDRSTSATRGRPQLANDLKNDCSTSATRGLPQLANDLKNDRSTSATRGRPQPKQPQPLTVSQKAADPSSTPKPMMMPRQRQSCSPSVTRGRKSSITQLEPKLDNNSSNKGTQIFLGSRMVEKVMNARKSQVSVEQRVTKQKLRTNETDGSVRTKHLEIKHDRNTLNHLGNIFPKRGYLKD